VFNRDKKFADRAGKIHTSMRTVNKVVESFVTSTGSIDRVKKIASRLHFTKPYRKVTMENIEWMLDLVERGEAPPDEEPMSIDGIGERTVLPLALASFGPLVPSPDIPAAPKLQITDGIPEKGFDNSRRVLMKQCSLRTAVDDWQTFFEKGFVRNGPTGTLSDRFMHVKMAGDKERERFFRALYKAHKAHVAKTKRTGQILDPVEVSAALVEEASDDEY